MSLITKQEKIEDITISIDAITCKKAQLATVRVTFGGKKYSSILSKLLWLFTQEKMLPCYMHPNTFVYNAIVGHNSIMFACPDSKVFNVILLIYMYVLKGKIPGPVAKTVDFGHDSYNEVLNALKNISINICGKCKSTHAAIASKGKKYEAFKKSLSELYKKYKGLEHQAAPNKNFVPIKRELTYKSSTNNQALMNLYLAIILNGLSCDVTQNNNVYTLTMNGVTDCNWSPALKNLYQARIKAFLAQFGTIGSDPSDKSKMDAYNAKCKTIIESLNQASKMLCGLYGLPHYTFNTPEQVRTVDVDLLTLLKNML